VSAHALLAELEAAGVRLTQHEGDVRFQTCSGVSIVPFHDRILANKPALLSILGGTESTASALLWRHVYQGPVEATAPPPCWDGTVCPGCQWPALCGVLGPRGASLPGGPCPA
jgi:hypothetical protein